MKIKRFFNFIKESVSSGINYLKIRSKLGSGIQREFFEWEYSIAKVINISKTPEYINIGKPKLKDCYRNSYRVVMNNYGDIIYVEGFIVLHGITIEHVWNRIGDIYFDVTAELSEDRNFTEYVSILELNSNELAKYSSELSII